MQLRNYRYYKITSPKEGLQESIIPAVEQKRSSGEYVEYKGKPPPLPPGVRISHAEDSGVAGVSRMYYFSEENYPELNQRYRIEREQALKASVNLYEIINGVVDNK